jgi:ribosomal protein S11
MQYIIFISWMNAQFFTTNKLFCSQDLLFGRRIGNPFFNGALNLFMHFSHVLFLGRLSSKGRLCQRLFSTHIEKDDSMQLTYKSLFPDDFSANRSPQLPPSPSIFSAIHPPPVSRDTFMKSDDSDNSSHTMNSMDDEADGTFSAAMDQQRWFTVRHFLRPNTLFGFYEPANREERIIAQVEKRNILQVLPRDILWHGNQLSKASSPAARLVARQKANLEAFNRLKISGTESVSNKEAEFDGGIEELPTAVDNLSVQLFAPRVLIQCRKNNIMIAVTDSHSRPLKHWTSGMLGFKNANKTTQKAALTMMDVLIAYLEERKISKIRLQFQGVNGVRQTILSQFRKDLPFGITHITDTTPLALGGGPRPKKARRL